MKHPLSEQSIFFFSMNMSNVCADTEISVISQYRPIAISQPIHQSGSTDNS